MKVLGISRSPRFSPNSSDRDMALFSAVASRLLRMGNDVSVISEDLFVDADLGEFDLVFSMARGNDVLGVLSEAEQQSGLPVFNSASALLQNSRSHLVKTIGQAHISQPPTVFLDLSAGIVPCEELSFPLWLKRGDACAQSEADVTFVSGSEQWHHSLTTFRERGITDVLAVEHVEGDLVKFYGVEGTDFFSYSYPTENNGFSKFGLEAHNGRPLYHPFRVEALKSMADCAAKTTGLTVYGGDAVIQADGNIHLIDFNDWPSFSTCRKAAAKAIARRLSCL